MSDTGTGTDTELATITYTCTHKRTAHIRWKRAFMTFTSVWFAFYFPRAYILIRSTVGVSADIVNFSSIRLDSTQRRHSIHVDMVKKCMRWMFLVLVVQLLLLLRLCYPFWPYGCCATTLEANRICLLVHRTRRRRRCCRCLGFFPVNIVVVVVFYIFSMCSVCFLCLLLVLYFTRTQHRTVCFVFAGSCAIAFLWISLSFSNSKRKYCARSGCVF